MLGDRIVVTKTDLADAARTERLLEHIGSLNPAPIGIAVGGNIEPSFLLDEPIVGRQSFDVGGVEHTHGLSSFSLMFEEALPWASFEQAKAAVTGQRR